MDSGSGKTATPVLGYGATSDEDKDGAAARTDSRCSFKYIMFAPCWSKFYRAPAARGACTMLQTRPVATGVFFSDAFLP
jgi:hypothetical protein